MIVSLRKVMFSDRGGVWCGMVIEGRVVEFCSSGQDGSFFFFFVGGSGSDEVVVGNIWGDVESRFERIDT